MKEKVYKEKKCKVCEIPFTPRMPLQRVCGIPCAIKLGRLKETEKRRKASQRVYRQRKEALRTKSDWMKLTQKEFNAFIRLRDHDRPCISCGRFHTGKWNAGHYRSVGAMGSMRFNELNCHKQCEPCNSHLSGNISEYRIGLISRIGLPLVEWLEKDHPRTKGWSIEELKALRGYYRDAQKATKAAMVD